MAKTERPARSPAGQTTAHGRGFDLIPVPFGDATGKIFAMDYRAPELRTARFHLTHFSLEMLLCLLALAGCQPQSGITETPAEFSINNTRVIDSPNRYGGSATDKTLQHIETRIRDYGLHADDVWFIYLRATKKNQPHRYYAEVYLPPRLVEGRLHQGDYVVFRTEALEQESIELSKIFGEPLPKTRFPYWWVEPSGPESLQEKLISLSLNSLPIEPLVDFPHVRVIALIDLMRTPPKMPDAVDVIEFDSHTYELVIPGEQVKPNRPIWKIEGTPDQPRISLLDSDRRRKRGQFVELKWESGEYRVSGIGLYGASTGWSTVY
ncbi:MAG: hypothetical protein AAF593_05450 [Planctomycetota bacterium]